LIFDLSIFVWHKPILVRFRLREGRTITGMRVSLPGRHILGVLKHLLEEKNDITKPPTGSPDLVPNLSGFPAGLCARSSRQPSR
jgi:hypothetical protein